MPPRETAIQLLQLIALTLPAVAIYLDTVFPNLDPQDMNDAEAANFHAIRVTFLLLLLSGFLLLSEVLLTPQNYEHTIVGAAIVVLAGALFTFVLPILFNSHALKDKRTILWPYRNLWHRIRDRIVRLTAWVKRKTP